jgi:ABC-type branched-subunit amino acid transport system ATPase component
VNPLRRLLGRSPDPVLARTEPATSAGADAVLRCSGIEVAYDRIQVLFGVDLEVRPGEVVALLGTNGAGKSTLLKAVNGIVGAKRGRIVLEGRDITATGAVDRVKAGIVQVPGGKAIFPTLTVGEHLRTGGWLYRKDTAYFDRAEREVLEMFPRLAERYHQLAGNLSGGEQQMLGLGMAFIAQPRLLMIDELSLGLAPTVVEELLGTVRRIRDQGTPIILVEQSVNVALSIADRAYFMEKGEVRFEGPAKDLLDSDVVRSVFLEGAATAMGGKAASGEAKTTTKKATTKKATKKKPTADTDETTETTETTETPLAEPRPRGTPVLELQDVRKTFGGVVAVAGASFALYEDEVLGVIGSNGAGKTTTFDLISGFLSVDSGHIRLLDQDITQVPAHGRPWLGLGRSFQDARLVGSLTVAENFAIGLERHLDEHDHVASTLNLPGIVRLEEDVAWSVGDLVELLGLGAFRNKFVRELSTGSRRIVELGMCIAHRPRVLILDEPSSGIAQKETEALAVLLRRIQAETGCSLMLIEHDMPLITGVSDRMVALEVGRVIAEGTPDEVISHPRVVASYLGGDSAVINRSGDMPQEESSDIDEPTAELVGGTDR